MNLIKGVKQTFLSASISVACAAPVFAAGTGSSVDFSSLTSSISFSSVVTGVLAIAAGIMGLKLAIVGARKIIAFLK